MTHLDSTAPRHDKGQARASASARLKLRFVYPGTARDVELGALTTLGRESACQARLLGIGASRQHARIERRGPVWLVEDLESRNGTFVDGVRLVTGSQAALERGTVLRLGDDCAVVVAPSPGEDVNFRELASGAWGSEVLARVLAPALRAAEDRLPILLCGPTGSGKERVARALHAMSGRPGDFVAINCAALPESLAESELFGVRRGAFSGSVRDTDGLLRSAHRGTLLLDEVLDLSLATQAKLLRAVDLGEVLPVGEVKVQAVDVRFIAAVQGSIDEAVSAGDFRKDLAARLDGLRVGLPPLSARREDVLPLFQMALHAAAGGRVPPAIEPDAVEALLTYGWPGNVRELEQCARRAVATSTGSTITRAELPEKVRDGRQAHPSGEERVARPDRAALIAALTRSHGVVATAARALGLTRQSTYRLMEEHRVEASQFRGR